MLENNSQSVIACPFIPAHKHSFPLKGGIQRPRSVTSSAQSQDDAQACASQATDTALAHLTSNVRSGRGKCSCNKSSRSAKGSLGSTPCSAVRRTSPDACSSSREVSGLARLAASWLSSLGTTHRYPLSSVVTSTVGARQCTCLGSWTVF